MNKRIIACLSALALVLALAFPAGAVCKYAFSADVMPPYEEQIPVYSTFPAPDADPQSEDATIQLYGYDTDVPGDTLPEGEDAPQKTSVVKSVAVCAVIGLVIALIVVLSVKSSYKPVRRSRDAAQYLVDGSLRVTASGETFVSSEITERTIENRNSSGE